MQQEEEGDLILSLVVEHGGLGQMKRKEGWTLLQNISSCNRQLYEYIKQRMSRLRLTIMGKFVIGFSDIYRRYCITCYEKNGLKEGIERLYRNDHDLPDEYTYENGRLNGQSRVYSSHDPYIMTSYRYKNDMLYGQLIHYYKNGQVSDITYVSQGAQPAHIIKYHENGEEMYNNWETVESYHKAIKKQKTE